MSYKEYPKVLIGITTYEGKDYIFPDCYNAVKNFDYPNYEVIVVDNSKTSAYVNKLRRKGYSKIHKIQRPKNSRDALSDSQNYIKNYFLKGNYDYLMFIESDLVPSPETLSQLINHRRQIVGATYYIGNDKLRVPCIFVLDYKKESVSMGTRLIALNEVDSYLNTGLRKVHGIGFGCVLFRRDLMNRFSFWTDERFDNKHSDVYFYMQLQNAGIPVFIDTNHVIPHYPSKWEDVGDK